MAWVAGLGRALDGEEERPVLHGLAGLVDEAGSPVAPGHRAPGAVQREAPALVCRDHDHGAFECFAY